MDEGRFFARLTTTHLGEFEKKKNVFLLFVLKVLFCAPILINGVVDGKVRERKGALLCKRLHLEEGVDARGRGGPLLLPVDD